MISGKSNAKLFMELLQPLERSLEVYCRRMLRDGSLVEDVLQCAIASAFKKFDRYVTGTNFRAWIFRFATLEIFNRNSKHESVVFGEIPADLPAEESWEFVLNCDVFDAMLEDPDVVLNLFDDDVVKAVERLAPLERATLLLRAVGDFSYKEIHELLSIPVGSVMGYLSRARKKMRLALAEYASARGLFRSPPSDDPMRQLKERT